MTEELLVKEKDIVSPGDVLAKGMGYLPGAGTYREGDEINASQLGLVNINGKVIKLVPLSGAYLPKSGDKIIAFVSDILMSGWRFNIRSAYSSMLSLAEGTSDYVPKGADLTQYYDIGDYALLAVTNVTSQKLIDLTIKGPGLRKLSGGRILEVNCKKVPRMIGKEGSMLNMIKQATGTNILVGQNGRVWLNGEPEKEGFAIKVLKYIEANAHLSGLTEKVKQMLESQVGDFSGFTMPSLPHVPQQERSSRPPRTGGYGGNRRGPPRGNFSGNRGPPRGPSRGPPHPRPSRPQGGNSQ